MSKKLSIIVVTAAVSMAIGTLIAWRYVIKTLEELSESLQHYEKDEW